MLTTVFSYVRCYKVYINKRMLSVRYFLLNKVL